VTVAWSASAGASSYNLKRGPSGGPYDTVTTGISALNRIDPGLNNGTVYCYVVSAVNSAGEGSNSSPQACATPVAVTFASQDVGAVGATGSWTVNGGTHTVRGAGTDVWPWPTPSASSTSRSPAT
jgi:cellulose 1,4-beta-cellobiosidase